MGLEGGNSHVLTFTAKRQHVVKQLHDLLVDNKKSRAAEDSQRMELKIVEKSQNASKYTALSVQVGLMEPSTSSNSNNNVWLFYPNLIGYDYIVLAIIAMYMVALLRDDMLCIERLMDG
ncbi:unnamed protein product [Caenorhabditis brenneri]